MPLPQGAHVKLGDRYYRLDEAADVPYRRFSRSIFADVPIVGSVGQNLQPGRLVWNQTNFDGEGQVVLDASDYASARRFYRSSGLDFKTAGQFQLNKAATLTLPTPSGSTDTTLQGNAGMSDVTGTSTANPTISGVDTWTAQTSGTTNNFLAASWANSRYYVTSQNNTDAYISTDGSTWSVNVAPIDYYGASPVYSPSLGLWVAVGVHIGTSGPTIAYSSDGLSWTTSASANSTSSTWYFWASLAWSVAESKFVAAGWRQTVSTGATVPYVATSTNGTSWNLTSLGGSGTLNVLARSENDDLWLAAIQGFTTYYTSSDASTWTSRTSPIAFNAVGYSETADLWVGVGASGAIYTSPDGITWTSRTSGSTASLYDIAYCGDTWVAVGQSGAILTSTDGTTWTTRSSGTTKGLVAVAYSSTQGTIAVGNGGTILKATGSGAATTTDRQLNAVGDVVKTSTHTPGATTVSVALYAYRNPTVNVSGQANPLVTFTVYNDSDSAVVTSTTATLSSTTTSSVATLTYTGTAAKNYTYRVTWTSGTGYKPIVDKVVYTVPSSSAAYTFQAMQLGQGGVPWVASSSTTASTNTTTYTYDFSTKTWTNRVTPASTADKKPLALAHTDKYQYVLLDNSIVYQATTAAVNAYIAATTATARGIAVTQNRLFVLGEDDTNGVIVYLYGIDQTSLPVAATTSVTVDNGKNSPDATLRQRMTASPNGAIFFVNYSTRGVVYQCDASGASPVVSILAELPEGVKATSIIHTGGLTFVAGQFLAPTGTSARSALFMIDQNGIIQRVGWFRRDDPDSRPVIAMQAYQNDLWMLQGGLLWRYSLTTGGLFLEHSLPASDPSTARGLAVTQDYAFAAYGNGVYVAGSSANYITSQASSLTSSVYDFGLPYEEKLLQSIEVTTYQLPANTAVTVEYQVDQNGVWVTAGTSYSGTTHSFRISDANYATRFHTLQIRTTPATSGGTATPVVKGVTVQAYTTTNEQLFEFALLTTDQDSETTLAGQDLNGSDLAAYVWELHDADALVTLLDGYSVGPYEEPSEYLCKIESVDHVNNAIGEGSVRLRLRVVA